MKKLLLTSALVAICAGAFAQGKVNLINDGASLVVLSTDTTQLKAADVGRAGTAVGNNAPLPSNITLMVGLYGGTSSSQLFLYSTYTMNNAASAAGAFGPTAIQLAANAVTGAPLINGIAGGTAIGAATPWFQIQVWDSAYANYAAAVTAGSSYVGKGKEFQMNPGNSFAYIFTAPAGVNSTWTDGPITLALVPEPSTFALAGLGAAALMIFRRRK